MSASKLPSIPTNSSQLTSFQGIFGSKQRVSRDDETENDHYMEDENVFMDPEWDMGQGSANAGAFASIAGLGMNPCLGVPPLECVYYANNKFSPKLTDTPTRTPQSLEGLHSLFTGRRRRRHLSLEDCQEGIDESSLSNDSFAFLQNTNNYNDDEMGLNRPKVNGYKEMTANGFSDLNPLKSFFNDLSYTSDLSQLEMGSDAISSSASREFESRILNAIRNSNPEVIVEFPPDLLAVIARHILQEAIEEPYGIKGCILTIQYEGQTALHHLGTLNYDPEVVAKTFELVLTLRQAQTSWGHRMARKFSFTNSTSVTVSTSYKLVKKRKYRQLSSESPTEVNSF